MRAADLLHLVAGAALLAAASLSAPAAADDAPTGDAELFFAEGRRLYDARRYDEACDKLAASVRLEPRVGSLGMLAACHEQIGKVASASREYARAADLARRSGDEREAYATSRAAALQLAAARLRFRFAETAPGEEVWIGGAPAILDGGLALVDPGHVDVLVRAPGRRDVHVQLDVARAQVTDVDIAALERVSPDESPDVAAVPERSAPDRGSGSTRKALGIAALSIGGTSLAAGLAFGIAAIADKNASSPYCDASDRCSPRGGVLRDRAAVDGNVATAAFGIGAAGLVAGVLVLVTGRPPASDRSALGVVPALGPKTAGASLTGAF